MSSSGPPPHPPQHPQQVPPTDSVPSFFSPVQQPVQSHSQQIHAPNASTSAVGIPLPDGPDPYVLNSTFPSLDAFRDSLLGYTVHRGLSYKVAKCSWYAYVVVCRDPHCLFKIRGVYTRKPDADIAASAVEGGGGGVDGADGNNEKSENSIVHDGRPPIVYPPSTPSESHPDYHWRVTISIPHSTTCNQDHRGWKHAVSYVKRGGARARRAPGSRNGFGRGRPRIGGIAIQVTGEDGQSRNRIRNYGEEDEIASMDGAAQAAVQRKSSVRPPPAKKIKTEKMVSPLSATTARLVDTFFTPGNADGGAAQMNPDEASFYLLSTLRYDPAFTLLPNDTAQRQAGLDATAASAIDPALQSPFYLLPYHVARLVAGARAFGWTDAVKALHDGQGKGVERLVRILNEACLRQQQQQQQQLNQQPLTPQQRQRQQQQLSIAPLRIRILLSSTGRIEVETNPVTTRINEHIFFLTPVECYDEPSYTFSTLRAVHSHITPWEVRIDTQPTTPSLFTQHKSTQRDVYSAARKRAGITAPTGLEVLIWGDDGQVLEGSVCSFYFRRPRQQQQGLSQQQGQQQQHLQQPLLDHASPEQLRAPTDMSAFGLESDDHSPLPLKQNQMQHPSQQGYTSGRDLWVTPPLSTGCNASTTRAYALERGLCREENVRVDELVDGEEIWMSNGLRGFVPAILRLKWAGQGQDRRQGQVLSA